MSRIYDALRTAEAKRCLKEALDGDLVGLMQKAEQRRSPRWELDVPLTVYGRGPSGSPFYVEAHAVNASAEGALILIRAPICEEQELLLINNYSSKVQLCRVVRVRSRDGEVNETGLSFKTPNLEFWDVPEDSSTLREETADEGF